MVATSSESALGTAETPRTPSTVVLARLLVALPLVVGLARTPAMVGLVFAASLLLAWHFRCWKPFPAIVLGALLLNVCVLSDFGMYSDADNYLQPNIRILVAGATESLPAGLSNFGHILLPQGFVGWCAALYRLTGWVDTGNSLIFMLLAAGWVTLRKDLTRLQTALLLFAPVTFTSFFCAMPDGCVGVLLLIALFALRQCDFWLALISLVVAVTFKTTAWIPAALIGLVLLRDHPRRWWQLALAALLCGAMLFPTLHALCDGTLQRVSNDFNHMDATAQSMGYWSRLLYAYIGHWTWWGETPHFNVPSGGIDGGGVDGLGPCFRVAIVASLVVLLFSRKHLKGWGTFLLVAWGSALMLPTLYLGYSRYTPLIYPAVMLPLVLRFPRLALIPAICVCLMPAAWVGWRLMLATENLTVAQHAEAVQSDSYNIQAALRPKLTATPQPTLSGFLYYTYSGTDFPAMPRTLTQDNRLTAASDKARGMASYAITTWLPWTLSHLPTLVCDTLSYRYETFTTFPRGINDGLSPTHP